MTLGLDSSHGLTVRTVSTRREAIPTSTRALAEVLDRLANPSLSIHLAESFDGTYRSLRAAVAGLNPSQRRALESQWGRTLDEITSLAQERDARVFENGVLEIYRRLCDQDRQALGAGMLQILSQRTGSGLAAPIAASPNFISRAHRELDILEGRGPWGAQMAHYGETIFHGATNLRGLSMFAIGAGAFQVVRLGALAQVLRVPALSGGLGQALAGAAGVIGEASAMTLSAQGFAWAAGEALGSDLDLLSRQAFGLGITLALLRGGGFATRSAFNRLHGIDPLTQQATRLASFSAVSQRLLPQVTMFGAIAIGHGIEMHYLGTRPVAERGPWLAQSFATLLEFNLAGRIFERVQPRGLAIFNHTLQAHSENLGRPPRSWFVFPEASGMLPAVVSGPRDLILESRGSGDGWPPRMANILSMMEKYGDGKASVTVEVAPASDRANDTARPVSSIVMRSPSWRKMLDALPAPAMATDSEGVLVYANAFAQDRFWRTPQDLMQMHLEDVFEPIPEHPTYFRAKNGLESGQVWQIEHRTLSGNYRAHFFFDRTAEWNLRSRVAELERENDRLSSKDQLVQEILHDQTTSLQGALTQGEMISRILDRPSDPPAVEGGEPVSRRWEMLKGRASQFGRATRHALAGVLNLRNLMRGGGHRQVLSLESVLESALNLNEGKRLNKDIQLITDFSKDLVVIGEEVPLVNAVLNILTNACHALPTGGELRIRTYSEGQMHIIEIGDSGTGIAPENLSLVFDRGFTTKRIEGGSGFGLHNVRWAVEELHHGRVEVESELGVGTVFRIILPSSAPPASQR